MFQGCLGIYTLSQPTYHLYYLGNLYYRSIHPDNVHHVVKLNQCTDRNPLGQTPPDKTPLGQKSPRKKTPWYKNPYKIYKGLLSYIYVWGILS